MNAKTLVPGHPPSPDAHEDTEFQKHADGSAQAAHAMIDRSMATAASCQQEIRAAKSGEETIPDDFLFRLRQANANLVTETLQSRVAVEQIQRTSEQRYRTLFESIDEGFCILERTGDGISEPLDFRFMEANPAFARQSGLSGVAGKTLRELVPDEYEEWLLTYDSVFRTGEPIRFERELVSQKRVLELHAFPVEEPLHRRVGVSFKDITERKRTEAALRESEAFNRSIIESSPDCIKILDLEGNLLSMQIGQALLGIEDIEPFLNTPWLDFWKSEHRGAAKAAIESAVAGRTGAFVGFFPTLRGEPKWWDVAITPILDAHGEPVRLLAVSRDVTERKQAEEALHESEERYRNLFNSMDEGFCIIEMIFDDHENPVDWRFLEINAAFKKHTGLHDVTGKRMRELAPDHEASWFEIYGKVARMGEPVRFLHEAKALDGRWFDLYAFQVGGQDSRKVAVLFTDVTERKQAEKVLRDSIRELRETESELRASQAALSREKAALADHVLRLEQMNLHLTVTTQQANMLAEEIEKSRIQMAHLAQHDALTDLPNRILLNDRMAQAISLAQRQDKQFALMFLDLDRFKHINDSLGHAVGDQLLRSVAERLTAVVRNSDTLCRLGGDEFVVLLANIDHPEDAALSAQKILAALALPYHIHRLELHVTASVGISIYPDNGRDADKLIQSADTAMYHAKKKGRNNYQFFEQNMNVRAVERHSVEGGLRRALQRHEFTLWYQPKYDLVTGRISGVEALVRWQHPQRGVVMPAQFIWIAEDSGLIVPVGRWVLEQACRQAKNWQDQGLLPVAMAVNISAVQFRHRDFLRSVEDILERTGLKPECLEFELTESVLMQDAESTAYVLKKLKDIGVRLAIDDFGTGYSSLSYLKRFPIDTLKIDQSFMRDITHTTMKSDDAAIVAAVISMGKSLNQRVIAEGVETRDQLAFLRALGCGEGQGFYFSRPLNEEGLVAMLRSGITPAVFS